MQRLQSCRDMWRILVAGRVCCTVDMDAPRINDAKDEHALRADRTPIAGRPWIDHNALTQGRSSIDSESIRIDPRSTRADPGSIIDRCGPNHGRFRAVPTSTPGRSCSSPGRCRIDPCRSHNDGRLRVDHRSIPGRSRIDPGSIPSIPRRSPTGHRLDPGSILDRSQADPDVSLVSPGSIPD